LLILFCENDKFMILSMKYVLIYFLSVQYQGIEEYEVALTTEAMGRSLIGCSKDRTRNF
jgi:hypothetical protein